MSNTLKSSRIYIYYIRLFAHFYGVTIDDRYAVHRTVTLVSAAPAAECHGCRLLNSTLLQNLAWILDKEKPLVALRAFQRMSWHCRLFSHCQKLVVCDGAGGFFALSSDKADLFR